MHAEDLMQEEEQLRKLRENLAKGSKAELGAGGKGAEGPKKEL